jgi:co-chaperonin GroES (HSP10)
MAYNIGQVQPEANRVLVKRIGNEETQRDDGLWVPGTDGAHSVQLANVLGVGPDVKRFKTGDKVLVDPHDRIPLSISGEDFEFYPEELVVASVAPESK